LSSRGEQLPSLEADVSVSPTPEEISEALERTGFLLEQEVARSLRDLGLHSSTGVAYQDPDEGKSREIDVLAMRTAHIDRDKLIVVNYEILCECKNTQWPFVLIGPPTMGGDFLREPPGYTFPVPHLGLPLDPEESSEVSRYILEPAFRVLGLADRHYYAESLRAVQIVRLHRRSNKWQADNEGLFDSIIYPIAKALLARKEANRVDPPPQSGQLALVHLCFPTVITSGRLYFVDATDEHSVPKEVSHVILLREIRTVNTSGHFMIDFVTKDGLSSFVQNKVQPFVEAVVQRVASLPPHYFHSEPEESDAG
jgi:hypothetical protein